MIHPPPCASDYVIGAWNDLLLRKSLQVLALAPRLLIIGLDMFRQAISRWCIFPGIVLDISMWPGVLQYIHRYNSDTSGTAKHTCFSEKIPACFVGYVAFFHERLTPR